MVADEGVKEEGAEEEEEEASTHVQSTRLNVSHRIYLHTVVSTHGLLTCCTHRLIMVYSHAARTG